MVPSRGRGVLAASLVGVGLVLVLGPPLLRDGICGLFGCADQAPDIAVTRTSRDRLAVLVPGPAAPDVGSVRLLEGGRSSGSQSWMVQRTPAGSTGTARAATPHVFVVGGEPDGFRTVTELQAPPSGPNWVAEVAFRCTTASLPFVPESLAVGDVRTWDGSVDGAAFAEGRRIEERCGTDRGGLERVLFWLGLVVVAGGVALGVAVFVARPVDDELDGDDAWGDRP